MGSDKLKLSRIEKVLISLTCAICAVLMCYYAASIKSVRPFAIITERSGEPVQLMAEEARSPALPSRPSSIPAAESSSRPSSGPASGEAELIGDNGEGGLVNINTATSDQLMTLPGIGQVMAARIIQYREENGDFKSAADITKVSGIGDKTFAAVAELITV